MFALACLLLFFSSNKTLSPVRNFFHFVFSPVEKIVYASSLKISGAKEFIFSLGDIKKENARLIQENQQLIAENAEAHDLRRENDFLREQLEILPRDSYDFSAARVVSQGVHGSENWIEIDKGSDNGIAEGMAVIISKGILIGKIEEVSATSSKVMLLVNSKSAVNVATVQNGSRGILRGEFGLSMFLDMVLNTDALSNGDDVITSGLGGSLPRGLYVGKVMEIRPSADHLFQQAVISSPVNFSSLELVFVITHDKRK